MIGPVSLKIGIKRRKMSKYYKYIVGNDTINMVVTFVVFWLFATASVSWALPLAEGTQKQIHVFINHKYLHINADGLISGAPTNVANETLWHRIALTDHGVKNGVLLRSSALCDYACINECGYVYSSHVPNNECVWEETYDEHNHRFFYKKFNNRTAYLALNLEGKLRRIVLQRKETLGDLLEPTNVQVQHYEGAFEYSCKPLYDKKLDYKPTKTCRNPPRHKKSARSPVLATATKAQAPVLPIPGTAEALLVPLPEAPAATPLTRSDEVDGSSDGSDGDDVDDDDVVSPATPVAATPIAVTPVLVAVTPVPAVPVAASLVANPVTPAQDLLPPLRAQKDPATNNLPPPNVGKTIVKNVLSNDIPLMLDNIDKAFVEGVDPKNFYYHGTEATLSIRTLDKPELTLSTDSRFATGNPNLEKIIKDLMEVKDNGVDTGNSSTRNTVFIQKTFTLKVCTKMLF
ncbi:fgf [Peridroma alphabaculovirus]|uniref:Fgf n=1 Tax=Peridroma alphabaculovirus TaxID=1346829 RepID=A0A068LK68_9ABAC|nr:fgf [Peridroma alphabaculovirus]AIE47764.1 fgf [Peridroma alphabaculovirus]